MRSRAIVGKPFGDYSRAIAAMHELRL